ncbi:MAG: condensation domain-containing protein, partial [Cyanobacteria bacterium J06554_6]
MNPTMLPLKDFLADLSRQEIKLWLEEDRLRCSGPDALMTDELSAQLKARKSEIIGFLKQVQPSTKTPEIVPTKRDSQAPLSFAQQRLWFLNQMQPDLAVYNLPMAIQVEGFLDVAALTQSLNEIVRRHEVLRTQFVIESGQPMQVIGEPVPIHIQQTDLQGVEDLADQVRQAAIAAAQTPFNLSQDRLFRVSLLRLSDTQAVVLFTLHHIIADAWSLEILVQELGIFYRAALMGQQATLPTLPVQYADFAIWQRDWLQGEQLEQQLNFWREQLDTNASVLQLPADFPRARVQTYRGAVEQFSLSKELSQQISTLAQRQSATVFMALLAAFKVLLYRYTGQTDVVVGTPIANRHRAEVEGLIGLFVNTLVLRSRLSPQETFNDLLDQVKATTLAAYDHQDLSFEKLVEVLQPERDLSYSPLFQVKFRLENAPQETLSLPGLTLKRLPQTVTTAKLDLSVDLYEAPDGIVGGFEYNSDLFKPETIQRMVAHFQMLLSALVAAPEQPIGELAMLTEAEQQQITTWNNTQKPYRDQTCFHYLFEEQATQTPNCTAIIYDDGTEVQQLSYQELNQRSNHLAHYLRFLGVGPEVVVGICVNRSPEMIVAMLAVMKAGGAYLPLDPTYPPERLDYMLSDAQVQVVLTQSDISLQTTAQRVDLDKQQFSDQPQTNPTPVVGPDHLAYLIYTSGSTGKPKGVLISHGGLVNLTE